MRKLFIVFMVLLIGGMAYAQEIEKKEEPKQIVQQCPKTKMTEGCLSCHVIPSFKLKESRPDATLDYPNLSTTFFGDTAYYLIEDIGAMAADRMFDFFKYVSWHPNVKHIVLEIQSPGGNMFVAWRIVGLMDLYKARGYTIETRCHGFAASAGFLIFANGSKGYRFASPTCEAMWHELITFKMFDISGPADKEDEAKVLRHLQDTANAWLVSRSKLSKEEWDQKIRKKEFWMNGKQAVEYGIADGTPK